MSPTINLITMKKTLVILLLLALTGCAATNQSWDLISGTLPYADPENLVFEGEVELNGWLVNVPAYVGPETEPHFRIAEESMHLMPAYNNSKDRRDYRIRNDELAQLLGDYDEENSAAVIAEKVVVVMEGNPSIYFRLAD